MKTQLDGVMLLVIHITLPMMVPDLILWELVDIYSLVLKTVVLLQICHGLKSKFNIDKPGVHPFQ